MKNDAVKKLFNKHEVLITCLLIVIWLSFSMINKNYATVNNFAAILRTMSFYGIIAVPLSFVIMQGNSDISTGASASFSAVFGTALMLNTNCFGMMETPNEWLGVLLCVVVAMLVGAAIGAINATMVVRYRMPPFIATVGMQYVLNGFKMVITGGTYVYPLPKALTSFVRIGLPIGRNKIAITFFIFLGVAIAAQLILAYTTYGRSVYSIGSNRIVAELSGIKTKRVCYTNYMVLHALVALVGVLNAGYLEQGTPTIGTDWHLTIMAACAIGGIKFSGGAGNMIGLLIGVFTMFSMNSAIAYTGASTFLQDVLIGVVLMVILIFDGVRANQKMRA